MCTFKHKNTSHDKHKQTTAQKLVKRRVFQKTYSPMVPSGRARVPRYLLSGYVSTACLNIPQKQNNFPALDHKLTDYLNKG